MAAGIAKNQARRAPSRGLLADDITSAAFEGLIDAADAYDPERGVAFNTYARGRVTGAVMDFLRTWDHLSRDMRLRAKTDEAFASTMPPPVPIEDVRRFNETVPDGGAVNPLEMAERNEVLDQLEAVAAKLPERMRLVLSLYYTNDLTLVEIGKVMGMTESRACQILGQAHATMRAEIAGARPASGRRSIETGTVHRTGRAYYWRMVRSGVDTTSKAWPTRALAEAELAMVIADPDFVPAQKRIISPPRCSKCWTVGHRAPACPGRSASET